MVPLSTETMPTGIRYTTSSNGHRTPTAVTNFTHCSLADDDIDAARVEPDPVKQKALWKKAQDKLVKEVCGIPIYEQLQVWAWKDNLDLGYELKGSLNLSPPIIETTHFK